MNKKINTCDELLARLESLNGETKQVKTGMQSTPAYNRTFWDFMRDGMPRNALKENSDGAGGYLVPDEYELKLVSALENENHLRRISNVIQTRHRLIIPTVIGHCAAAWNEEGEQITETEPSFGQIVLDAYKMGTLILASDELLEDSGADIEKLILEQFSQRIGKCEEEAFLTGDGNHKPMGLLTQAPVGSVSAEAGVLSAEDALFPLGKSIGRTPCGLCPKMLIAHCAKFKAPWDETSGSLPLWKESQKSCLDVRSMSVNLCQK